jgi:hypothetical protein
LTGASYPWRFLLGLAITTGLAVGLASYFLLGDRSSARGGNQPVCSVVGGLQSVEQRFLRNAVLQRRPARAGCLISAEFRSMLPRPWYTGIVPLRTHRPDSAVIRVLATRRENGARYESLLLRTAEGEAGLFLLTAVPDGSGGWRINYFGSLPSFPVPGRQPVSSG